MNRSLPGSLPSALPSPVLLACGGLLATTVLIFAAIGIRGLVGIELDPGAEPAAASSSAPAASSTAASSVPTATEPPAADAATARELRAKLQRDLEMGKFPAFVDGLPELLKADPEAAADRKLRSSIIDVLMVIMAGRGEHADKLFDIIEHQMGTHGIDLLYQLVVAHGGSRASARAGELLRDPEVRARGSAAMRVAYDLRNAPCAQKSQLFTRAKEDGDQRALAMLEVLKNPCGRRNNNCCQHAKDPLLQEAIDALRAKYPTN